MLKQPVLLQTQPEKPKSHGEKSFFSRKYNSFLIQIGFEQLSSSICWRVIPI